MKRTGNEIIEYILNDLGIKAPTFAAMINVGYPRIHDIQREKTKKISAELANKIVSRFSQYSISWIISGEGDIYNGTLTERLDMYCDFHKISIDNFLLAINMTPPRYTLITSSNIKSGELNAIYSNCPDLNPDWLLTGIGEMLKNELHKSIEKPVETSISNEAWEMIKKQADIITSQQETINILSKKYLL